MCSLHNGLYLDLDCNGDVRRHSKLFGPSVPAYSLKPLVSGVTLVNSTLKSPQNESLNLVTVVICGLPQPLSYLLPSKIEDISIGDEVVVPLGSRQRRGWVIGYGPQEVVDETKEEKSKLSATQIDIFAKSSNTNFKEIIEVHPAFQSRQIELFRWMSEYYGVGIADILSTALPKRKQSRQVSVYSLSSKKLLEDELEKLKNRAPQQSLVLNTLLNSKDMLSLEQCAEESGLTPQSTRSALSALIKKNLAIVSKQKKLIEAEKNCTNYVNKPNHLTDGQSAALKKINQKLDTKKFSPFLLFGVTGSGKTEVYIRAIEHTLAQGRSAILLVPEISLTPQLVDQLSTRLKEPLALLHSQVAESQRWNYWEEIHSGNYRVAVGARSALFAPLKDLGLIIIDEEHETSYKQSDGFRYHGRDVAVMRAKTEDCTLILGSATPSLETLANVQKKRYSLLELPDRVHSRPVPKIEIVDLLKIAKKNMPAPTISPELHQALSAILEQNQQAVILYNKRGFSSYLQCDTCAETVCCNECSVALTYHKGKEILLCHYCGQQSPIPSACAYCRDPKTVVAEEEGAVLPGELSHRGAGTERVVEDLALLFPEAKVARMDRDTISAKDSYRKILNTMRSGEADILVGTQMIAKGHDLPGVTLVGIVDADVGLHVPDFRTSERVYQLITQAAGRAGRGELSGRVIVQTRQAAHPTIVATSTGRFLAFARFQLEQREKLGYPPYARLLRVIISAEQQRNAISGAEQLLSRYKLINKELNDSSLQLLGPAPAPHQRLRGLYRWHILVKSRSARQLAQLALATHQWRKTDFKDCRIAVDVDPVDML